jgi:predicted GIY-YIG superfamily endonuclease
MNLEKIKLSELPSVDLLEKERLPHCAAIYFVSDSQGQIFYIGRTINLFERWQAHHRFNQLKRFNRKNKLKISWFICSADIEIISHLENEFIKLHKPPLNWTKVVKPVRKITPAETALQESLKQLAKFNTMIFGFDPILDKEPPTIYLVYPVYGMRGVAGSIRTALKKNNKKASSLKWKEYKTFPKSAGNFGFWETQYNELRIDISPVQGLVNFMQDSTLCTLAGVEFKAFTREQLELALATMQENGENTSGLGAVEDDPIPITFVDKHQAKNEFFAVEPWEELEPMSEGEVRVMTRQFVYVDDVEIEICTNENGKYFVRHNVYWWIIHRNKNPDPVGNCVIQNTQNAVNKLPTIRWCGYRYRFETIIFSEDDVEVESVLLPLAMFEDLMKDKTRFNNQVLEQILKGEYQSTYYDKQSIKLFTWLQSNSLFSLVQTQNNNPPNQ